jgi:hypothetical protein
VNTLILSAALLFGIAPVADGSLLFLENSNQFVELYTGADVSHVAVVVYIDRVPHVYEALPAQVRLLALDEYFAEIGQINRGRSDANKIRVWLAEPKVAYSAQQLGAMRAELDARLGQRYSVKTYVRGKGDGIHCAELATRALCAAKVLAVEKPESVSPDGLLKLVYGRSRELHILEIAEPDKRPRWIRRRWDDVCGFASWCRWSSWEACTWCW